MFLNNSLLKMYVRNLINESSTMNQLRSLSQEDALRFLEKNATFVGQGIGRSVYDLGNNVVVKLARDSDGITQNKNEANVQRSCPAAPVPHLIDKSEDWSWISVEKVMPLKGHQIDDYVNQMVPEADSLSDLISMIRSGMFEDYVFNDKHQYKRAERFHKHLYASNRWYKGMVEMMIKCELDFDELHEANWGVDSSGKLVLLDAGM